MYSYLTVRYFAQGVASLYFIVDNFYEYDFLCYLKK